MPKETVDANEIYQIIAELFHDATGLLAPGKYRSPAAGSMDEEQLIELELKWKEFLTCNSGFKMAVVKKISALNNKLRNLEQDLKNSCDEICSLRDKVDFLENQDDNYTNETYKKDSDSECNEISICNM